MRAALVFGSGFVGAAIERALADHGPVESLGRSRDPALAHLDHTATRALHAHLERTGADTVVNAAGRLQGDADELDDANHRWPTWLAGALAGTGVRLVHVGSAAEYGDPGGPDPIAEDAPTRPTSLYGTTKLAGTQAVLAAAEGGLDAVVVRGFNLVGANVAPSSPLHQFRGDVTALPAEGGSVEVWDAGTVRDFVLVEDLAALVAELRAGSPEAGVCNACSGVGLRYGDIVAALARHQRKAVEVVDLGRPGIPVVVGDPGRATGILGRRPEMDLDLLATRLLEAADGAE